MPIITEIQLVEVPIGSASVFRKTINDNFDAIKNEFNEVYDVMVDVELSSTQPENQKVGDFWFKELTN